MFQPLSVACPIVVSGNRLHTLANPYNHENQEVTVCITDTISSHGKVPTIAQQLRIEDADYTSGSQIHQKRAHADECDVLEDISFQLPGVRLETDKR